VIAGLTFGLIAALGWGAEDLIGSYVSRRLGVLTTTLASSVIGLALLAVLIVGLRPGFPSDTNALGQLLLLGLPIGATYFAIFYALRLGPVAVVSPMMATYGVCSVVLAVVFLGEHPGPVQAAAVPLAGIGSVLCAVTLDAGSWRPRIAGIGPLVALGVVVMSAAVTIAMKRPLAQIDWLVATFAVRLTATLLVIAVGAALWLGRRPWGASPTAHRPRLNVSVLLLVSGIGIFDTAGVMAFTRGLQESSAWIVALAASMSPTIVILGATWIFRERLRATQWLGVGLVASSVAVLALG
jgi:drug/metabolite transporter (DMT)-like permease